MNLDINITEAIQAVIAKEIINGLQTEQREALLIKSITEALNSYDFRSAVQKTVTAEAEKIAKELMLTNEWQKQISQAISNGFNKYLTNLEKAVEKMLKDSMHGRDGSYQQAGRILANWAE